MRSSAFVISRRGSLGRKREREVDIDRSDLCRHRGGPGIGRAAALRLSAEGHRVALVSRTEHELLRTAASCPGETLVLPTDVTGADSAGEVLDAVAETWGPAQILVVAAGRNRSAPLERTSDAHWQEMLALNLTSVFQWLRAALPRWRRRAGDARSSCRPSRASGVSGT